MDYKNILLYINDYLDVVEGGTGDGKVRTFTFHAGRQALLQPAKLAPIPVKFGHRTVLGPAAHIGNLFPNGTLEKS